MVRPALGAFCAAVSLALLSQPARAANAGVAPGAFGSAVLAASTTPYDARWSRALAPALGSGAQFVRAARDLEGLERLRFVNRAVNQAIRYSEDASNWGQGDYWATAAETFARGAGDCEDYAIAKMQLLRASGVPAKDLYLVIGTDPVARGAHALLLVHFADGDWVLDNVSDRVRQDAAYREFRPVMTLSTGGKWLHGIKATAPAPGPANRGISRSPAGSTLAAVVAAQMKGRS